MIMGEQSCDFTRSQSKPTADRSSFVFWYPCVAATFPPRFGPESASRTDMHIPSPSRDARSDQSLMGLV